MNVQLNKLEMNVLSLLATSYYTTGTGQAFSADCFDVVRSWPMITKSIKSLHAKGILRSVTKIADENDVMVVFVEEVEEILGQPTLTGTHQLSTLDLKAALSTDTAEVAAPKAMVTREFLHGTWAETLKQVAAHRNFGLQEIKAEDEYACIVERYRLAIRKVGRKANLGIIEGVRGKRVVEAFAADFLADHPGTAIEVVYIGVFDGTDCLPDYSAGDFVPEVGKFELPVYRAK